MPGRELGGIHLAMSFLRGNTRRLLDGGADAERADQRRGQATSSSSAAATPGRTASGRRSGRARRASASSSCWRRPPIERAADNPWPEWPKVYKLDYGQEEAQALWGEDPRRYSTTTRRFIGRNEHVTGIEIADLTWQTGPDGKVGMREVPGTDQVLPADLVLLALGFLGPEPVAAEGVRVRAGPARQRPRRRRPDDQRARACSPPATASRGQSLVVWAIKEGRQAAEGVDRYLARPY